MHLHHPGRTPDTGQPRRTADRTATPAPRLAAPVHRYAGDGVPDSPGQPLAAPLTEDPQARLGGDFCWVPVHTDRAARGTVSGLNISDPGDRPEAETIARRTLSGPSPQHTAHRLPPSLPPPPAALGTRAAIQRMLADEPARPLAPVPAPAPKPAPLVTQAELERAAGFRHSFARIPVFSPVSDDPGAQGGMLGQARNQYGAGCGDQQTAPGPVQRSAVHDVLRGPGQPLAAPLQEEMEARLDADFSHVRVHTDAAARASAAEVGARAYTFGSHVVIGDGGADKHTFAHELAHVIQQPQGPVPGTDSGTGLKVSDPGDRLEKEAEATAAQVMAGPAQAPAAGHHRPASTAMGATVQRLVVAQITSHDGQKVEDLNIAGRPESPYTGTMGDHSTAFAVQVEAIRRRVLGRDPTQAAKEIGQLIIEVGGAPAEAVSSHASALTSATTSAANPQGLPGAQPDLIDRLPPKHKAALENTRNLLQKECDEFANVPEHMKLLKIQKMIGDFLHYRELIPLTTMNVKALFPALAGKGKGEPGHIKTLADHADGQKKEPEALQEAVKGLLDGQGVALVATESEAYKLEQLAPGIDPGLSQDERAKLIVKQHLMSIDMAYPGLIAQAWPNANKDTLISKATDDLLVPLRDLIEKRRESNRDFYRERIAATDERIQALQSERPDGRTKKALKEWEEIRQDLVKVLVANGGAQPPPPQGLPARRTRQAPGRYGPSYQYPEERKAKGKGKGKGTQSGPMEMDIDSEGVDPGDRTSQEADETEEEAVEAESRKQSLTSQIQLAENGRIVGFESAGRSPSPFGSQGMGAHTTAWTVHLDVIRRTILNQKVPDAITKLQALSNEARATRTKMEGAGFEVVDEQHQTNLKNSLGKLTSDIKAADKAAPQAQPILLQQAINSLLTYINYIPGATIVAADTGGKNEGRIRRQLLAHEQSSEKILTKKELRANLLGLLDLKGVGDDKKRLALLENHLKLVETAYPKSWADSGLGGGDPTAVLEEWVKTTGKKD